MNYKTVLTGMLGENCYIIYNTDKCIIVDPGDEKEKIKKQIQELSLVPSAILLTHGHFDHTGASYDLAKDFNIPIYISKKDYDYISDRRESVFYMEKPLTQDMVTFVSDSDILKIADMEFSVMETPGHSKGSVCYFADNLMISGDLLFLGSVGRTDLDGGSSEEMRETFINKIDKIQENFAVLPGHGETTTLEYEKKHNQYMKYYATKL